MYLSASTKIDQMLKFTVEAIWNTVKPALVIKTHGVQKVDERRSPWGQSMCPTHHRPFDDNTMIQQVRQRDLI